MENCLSVPFVISVISTVSRAIAFRYSILVHQIPSTNCKISTLTNEHGSRSLDRIQVILYHAYVLQAILRITVLTVQYNPDYTNT